MISRNEYIVDIYNGDGEESPSVITWTTIVRLIIIKNNFTNIVTPDRIRYDVVVVTALNLFEKALLVAKILGKDVVRCRM